MGAAVGRGQSAYYLSVNRNKRSVVLDLREPADRERALRLARAADVLVENFRPGAMERLGLGYDALSADNPRLVYCAISGFGRGRGVPGGLIDFLVQAVGGLMSITGPADGEPTKVGVAVVDVITGLFATIGILAALAERERSGRGQRVDTSLMASLLAAMVNQSSGYAGTGISPGADGQRPPQRRALRAVPDRGRPDRARRRQRPAVHGPGHRPGRPRARRGRPLRDQRRTASRIAPSCATLWRPGLAERPVAAWIAALQEVGVPCGRVNDLHGAFTMAAELGLEPTFEMRDAQERVLTQVRNPLELSRTPVAYVHPPPATASSTGELRRAARRARAAPRRLSVSPRKPGQPSRGTTLAAARPPSMATSVPLTKPDSSPRR